MKYMYKYVLILLAFSLCSSVFCQSFNRDYIAYTPKINQYIIDKIDNTTDSLLNSCGCAYPIFVNIYQGNHMDTTMVKDIVVEYYIGLDYFKRIEYYNFPDFFLLGDKVILLISPFVPNERTIKKRVKFYSKILLRYQRVYLVDGIYFNETLKIE